MPSLYIKYSLVVLLLIVIVFPFGCKKSSTSPAVDDLTRPVIWLNTFEISFVAVKSEGNPEPQILQIKNTGIDTLDYDITCEADWIEIEPSSGKSSGEINGHEISAKKTGLEVRDEPYTATIKITDPNSYNNPQEVNVSMTVSKEPPPAIAVSPKNLDFTAQEGGSNPSSQTIEIVNIGKGTLKYEIESDANWLKVEPDSGRSKTSSKTHTVKCSVGSRNIGTYTGKLKIRDPNATNSPQTVNVNLNITKEPPPEIWTSTGSLTFQATAGGSDPPVKTLRIKNSGGGTLKYNITWDANWAAVNPTSGSSSGGTNSHNVAIDISGKTAGSYHGAITIYDSGASNSPQTVNLNLEINPPLGNNRIWVGCSPSSAYPNDTVTVSIGVDGNTNIIGAFGVKLTYDTSMFQYQNTSKGNLVGDWGFFGGNDINGVVTIGGSFGLGTPISSGSQGTIARVTFVVTGGSYPNGQTSQLQISNYTDDIAGMSPEPANTTFTLRK